MLGAVLGIGVAIALVYLILSLMVMALTEIVAQLFARRAQVLERAIRTLFNEGDQISERKLTQAFYHHPLIRSLKNGNQKPSYIPADSFTLALFDLVVHGTETNTFKPIKTLDALRTEVMATVNDNALINKNLRRQLQILLDLADNLDQARIAVATWFNNTMERVTGWYKRSTQLIVILCSVLLTVAVNADTVLLVNAISSNAELGSILNAAAPEYVTTGATTQENPDQASERLQRLKAELDSFNVIGWCFEGCAIGHPRVLPEGWGIVSKVVGLLLTILVTSLGASFWFDLLKRFMNVRATGTAQPHTGRSTSDPASSGATRQ